MISENMKMMFEIGLVPLVVIDDAADAVPFGQALVDGGVPVAEVTFRTDACLGHHAAISMCRTSSSVLEPYLSLIRATSDRQVACWGIVTPAPNLPLHNGVLIIMSISSRGRSARLILKRPTVWELKSASSSQLLRTVASKP